MTENNTKGLICYDKLLEEIKQDKQKGLGCHLLLGNGFNNSLSIVTSYQSIFEKMQEKEPIYKKITNRMEDISFDIEKLLGDVDREIKTEKQNPTSSHNEPKAKSEADFIKEFLSPYIQQKIKLDFMTAASEIVHNKFNKIYKKNREDIHLLFKDFSNYFTLNYDPLLYLLLMKIKSDENSKKSNDIRGVDALFFDNSIAYKKNEINTAADGLYDKLKKFWNDGKVMASFEDEQWNGLEVRDLPEKKIENLISIFKGKILKGKKISDKEIRNTLRLVLDEKRPEEEQKYETIEVNDGFIKKDFSEESKDQNVFFLHGNFHMYKKENSKAKEYSIFKITETTNDSFMSNVHEKIFNASNDLVWVLENKSEDKLRKIENNSYLSKGYKKLSDLKGSMVIFGSSLDENDQHIFSAITASNIKKIYISTSEEEIEDTKKKAKERFKDYLKKKNKIVYFDYKTVSFRDSQKNYKSKRAVG